MRSKLEKSKRSRGPKLWQFSSTERPWLLTNAGQIKIRRRVACGSGIDWLEFNYRPDPETRQRRHGLPASFLTCGHSSFCQRPILS